MPGPWTASEPATEVIGAFVKAVMSLDDIVKDSKVEAGPMRYSFASLTAVLNEVRPKLAAQGLVLSQVPTVEDGVYTLIFHESGQWMEFAPLRIEPAGRTPQNVGSAITYSRRYTILAVLGLSTEDDDGAAGSVATPQADPIPEEDPVAERVNTVIKTLKGLSDENKATLKEFADGRSLAPNALYRNHDLLAEVEAFLSERLGIGDS